MSAIYGVYPHYLFLTLFVYSLGLSGIVRGQTSQEQIVEVVETSKFQDDDSFPEMMTLTFGLGQNQINSTFKRNVYVQGNIPVYLGKNGQIIRWKDGDDTVRFAAYCNPNITASVIAVPVEGSQAEFGLHGSFMVASEHFNIEPAPETSKRRRRRRKRQRPVGETSRVLHKVYPQEDTQEEANYFDYRMEMQNKQATEFMFRNEPRFPTRVERQREEIRSNNQQRKNGDQDWGQPLVPRYSVETLIMVDNDLYQSWLSRSSKVSSEEREEETIGRLQQYFAHVANGADMLYRSMDDSGVKIYVQPVALYIAMEASMAPWIEANKEAASSSDEPSVQAGPTLTSLELWLDDTKSQLPAYDLALLYTKNYLTSPYGERILGMAVMHSVCTRYSLAVVRDLEQYSTIQTTAHEMGHCMGAYHDGRENGCSQNDIMGDTQEALEFSSCSATDFRTFLTWLSDREENCLLEEPMVPVPVGTTKGPDAGMEGRLYTPDEQCQTLYGFGSFYCGGKERDSLICTEMQCWIPTRRECYRTPDQKALSGTTCGNRKWCFENQCVKNSDAPEAPDVCVYGDFKGGIQRGRTCHVMMQETPWDCYDALYGDNCCASCEQLRNPLRTGCEFGDKGFECSYLERNLCYRPDKESLCCEACASQRRDTPGCEYGDKELWCADVIQNNRDCYDYGDVCCESCRQYKTQDQGCPYGDKAPICDRIEPRFCYSNSDACCKTCPVMYRNKPGCEYGDRTDTCTTVKAYECYYRNTSCCMSCEKHRTGVPGCEFGDKSRICSLDDCADDIGQRRCCRTCMGFVPTTVPSPITTTVPSPITTPVPSPITTTVSIETSPSFPRTTSRLVTSTVASFTSTQRPITRPPPVCPTGDQANWCRDMPAKDCYVSDQLCCETCPKLHTGVPGCEYGDHNSWCKDMSRNDCKNSKTALACCVTCSNIGVNIPSASTTSPISVLPWTGCSGEDRAKWCINIHPWDCYSSEGICCSTCRRFHIGIKGCVFGDRVSWCGRNVRRPEDCQRRDIKDNCCQTCAQYNREPERTTVTPLLTSTGSGELSRTATDEFFKDCVKDKWTDFCTDVGKNPQFCYHDKDNCCASCRPHFTSVDGCEFGDRVSWCSYHIHHGGSCYAHDLAYQCCKSCAQYYTGITGCEFGDRKDNCSPQDCQDSEKRLECCSTCAPTTVMPLVTPPSSDGQHRLISEECSGGDKAGFCNGLHPSFCYYDRVYHQCCSTCTQYRRPEKPSCEFGDRRTWCPTIIHQECVHYQEECCETCT